MAPKALVVGSTLRFVDRGEQTPEGRPRAEETVCHYRVGGAYGETDVARKPGRGPDEGTAVRWM